MAYQTIETLEEYMIVAQDRSDVTIFRRANKWAPESTVGLNQNISLKSLDLALPLTVLYEGVLKLDS